MKCDKCRKKTGQLYANTETREWLCKDCFNPIAAKHVIKDEETKPKIIKK